MKNISIVKRGGSEFNYSILKKTVNSAETLFILPQSQLVQ